MAFRMEFVVGIILVLIVIWNVFLGVQVFRADVRAQTALAAALQPSVALSPSNLCPTKTGFVLVKPNVEQTKDYLVTAGQIGDQNRVFFCFYEKT